MIGPHDLLLRTRSIHSFGMKTPLRWIALDGDGTVIRSGVLSPSSVATVWSARFMLEQPPTRPIPDEGAQLTICPRSEV